MTDSFGARVQRLRDGLDGLRIAQSVDSHSWLNYTLVTPATADISAGTPVAAGYSQLYLVRYNVDNAPASAFANIMIRASALNTGVGYSSGAKHDDPLAIYVRVFRMDGTGIADADAYIRLKFRVESPFDGTLSVTAL